VALLAFSICRDALVLKATADVTTATGSSDDDRQLFPPLYEHKLRRMTNTVDAARKAMTLQSAQLRRRVVGAMQQQRANARKVQLLEAQVARMEENLRHTQYSTAAQRQQQEQQRQAQQHRQMQQVQMRQQRQQQQQ
jgi:hypothetical protein